MNLEINHPFYAEELSWPVDEEEPSWPGDSRAPLTSINPPVGGPPPHYFRDAVIRVFPLTAHYRQLERFCHSYLNKFSSEIHFKPALPVVFLIAINYGRMESDALTEGWVAQNELLFNIPLEIRGKRGGDYVFERWCSFSPYIFVDNDTSIVFGREVLGWPKIKGWFAPSLNPWAIHPRASQTLLSLSTRVFPKLFAGMRQTPSTLLEVKRRPELAPVVFPPSIFEYLPRLFAWDNMVSEMSALMTEFVFGVQLRQSPSSVAEGALRRLQELFRMILGRGRFGTINLKQFRDIEDQYNACYRALTLSEMAPLGVKRAGLLGGMASLSGDLSGGFRIHIYRYEAQPIVDSLGLNCRPAKEPGKGHYDVLEPYLPFWLEADLEYSSGLNLIEENKSVRITNFPGRREKKRVVEKKKATDRMPYNTTRGHAIAAIEGPHEFSGVTAFVFRLEADEYKLLALCQRQFRVLPPRSRLEVIGSSVYLVILDFGEVSSLADSAGFWAEKAVLFMVPITIESERIDVGEGTRGFYIPYAFMDGTVAVITLREVYGWPVRFGDLGFSQSFATGIQGTGLAWARLESEIAPTLQRGQKLRNRLLIELGRSELDQSQGSFSHEVRGTEEIRPSECLSGEEEALQFITIKEFEDADGSNQACYQALLTSRWTGSGNTSRLRGEFELRFHRYPSLPIVENLGLKVGHRQSGEERPDSSNFAGEWHGVPVDIVKPVGAFTRYFRRGELTGEYLYDLRGKG